MIKNLENRVKKLEQEKRLIAGEEITIIRNVLDVKDGIRTLTEYDKRVIRAKNLWFTFIYCLS